LYIEDYFNRKVLKQAYLKSKYGVYHIIERVNFARMDATLRADINELFGVLVSEPTINMGKVVIDPFVNTLMDMQEEYFDIVKAHALNYDTLEIPEDYIAERKAMRSMITPEMRKLSINVKFVGMHGKGERITLANLFDFRMPIFYGTSEDESKLYESFDLYCKLFSEKHIMVHSINEYDYMTNKKVHIWKNRFWSANSAQIMFIQLAQNNVKYMRYCQNAIHINDFFRRMLHRKEDVIMKYFQVYQVIERFNNLQYYYRDANFVKIDETWGKHILTLKEYIKAIPEKAKDETIGKKKRELSKYFDIANIKLGKEEKKINKMIEDLEFLYEVNKEIMSFIDMPYSLSDLKPTQVDILKKIMVL